MGYPMTYQRVVNRNALVKGDYDSPGDHAAGMNLDAIPIAPDMAKRTLERHEHAWRMLLGDLRRLEADALDERVTCQTIALRTGIDAEIVAAVLKEFVSW